MPETRVQQNNLKLFNSSKNCSSAWTSAGFIASAPLERRLSAARATNTVRDPSNLNYIFQTKKKHSNFSPNFELILLWTPRMKKPRTESTSESKHELHIFCEANPTRDDIFDRSQFKTLIMPETRVQQNNLELFNSFKNCSSAWTSAVFISRAPLERRSSATRAINTVRDPSNLNYTIQTSRFWGSGCL